MLRGRLRAAGRGDGNPINVYVESPWGRSIPNVADGITSGGFGYRRHIDNLCYFQRLLRTVLNLVSLTQNRCGHTVKDDEIIIIAGGARRVVPRQIDRRGS